MKVKSDEIEKLVVAMEKIADSLRSIEDTVLDLDLPLWSERLEWYLHEFYNMAKSKTIGESERPPMDRERLVEEEPE
jgi:hypothetical protein